MVGVLPSPTSKNRITRKPTCRIISTALTGPDRVGGVGGDGFSLLEGSAPDTKHRNGWRTALTAELRALIDQPIEHGY